MPASGVQETERLSTKVSWCGTQQYVSPARQVRGSPVAGHLHMPRHNGHKTRQRARAKEKDDASRKARNALVREVCLKKQAPPQRQ